MTVILSSESKYQHHVPCGSCIHLNCSDGQYFEPPQMNMRDGTAEKTTPETADSRTMKGIQQQHELLNLCQTIQVSRCKSLKPRPFASRI